MKKIIICLALILIGCNNQNSKSEKTDGEEEICINIEKEKNNLSLSEAWNLFLDKVKDKLGDETKTEALGVIVYEDRIYYGFRSYLDSPSKKTVTGNYAVDIYTGDVYQTDTGDYIRLE
ncbi:putative lipoprotein NlpE involved in copper resistance [Breznakia sp. PF5-3]|uniref:hypothetical protein n=1 Tax=unclassified Breznakia TaxID=2623764 RepID=UPI002404966C|nr:MULTISPECIES: hypothetical protein [unclassified Breznakia]MDF9825861.1 putative lipoprotein NlpE involved in copper resistance [Breznakia sp. PM6-1]MDF9836647.1 putative lipoprotein NlpE involved in copper resistance [Breznakia sp. PF5-3]MDF9838901.1 putative lipoprotein NlpE involved in copper resistance [Breznakia sp. PFB2-8]MDF9860932.1 putative lipoprotein NlpE involved in copper resistance [Breznakia sp. PH5-24]